MALSNCAHQVIWIKRMFGKLEYCYRNPLVVRVSYGIAKEVIHFPPCPRIHRPQTPPALPPHSETTSSWSPLASFFPSGVLAASCLPPCPLDSTRFCPHFSSAICLVSSALLLRIASLFPHVVGPNGPPTIPVPAALYCGHVCFSLRTLFSDWLFVPRACPYSIMDSDAEF